MSINFPGVQLGPRKKEIGASSTVTAKRLKQQSSGKLPQSRRTDPHKHRGTSKDPARRQGGTHTPLLGPLSPPHSSHSLAGKPRSRRPEGSAGPVGSSIPLSFRPLGKGGRSVPRGLAAGLRRCPAATRRARPDPAVPPGRTDTPSPGGRAPSRPVTLPAGCQGNYGPPRAQSSSAGRARGGAVRREHARRGAGGGATASGRGVWRPAPAGGNVAAPAAWVPGVRSRHRPAVLEAVAAGLPGQPGRWEVPGS